MKLFTAITFHEEIKNKLYQAILKLKDNSLSGTFTIKDNLHLTLNFIGETGSLDKVKQAMDQAASMAKIQSFDIKIEGYGSFHRREGDICWIGVQEESSLWRLQKELNRTLQQAGFDMEDREFKPHLTLGRRVRLKSDFIPQSIVNNMAPMIMEVDKICLMNSERVAGKLAYTEIYHIKL